jgi:hypothetical protein
MTAESDLLTSLVNEQPPYPWLPSHPASEPYFTQAAAELEDALLDQAIAAGWQRLSSQLETLWADQAAAAHTLTQTLAQTLIAQFQSRVPVDRLQIIAATVADLSHRGQSYLDQLVNCASAVLPTWDRGDLAVLARPLAYSLRGGQSEILDLNLRTMQQVDWDALSEIEQARLSLAIAAVALKAVDAESAS